MFDQLLTNALKYKATEADAAEKAKKASLTFRNGLSISSRRRCFVVNPPNFSPRSSASFGEENSVVDVTDNNCGGDVTVDVVLDSEDVNASVGEASSSVERRMGRRFILILLLVVQNSVLLSFICLCFFGVGGCLGLCWLLVYAIVSSVLVLFV